jgi:hypothetical protein
MKTGQAKHGDMEHFPNWRLATRTRGMLRKHSEVCFHFFEQKRKLARGIKE